MMSYKNSGNYSRFFRKIASIQDFKAIFCFPGSPKHGVSVRKNIAIGFAVLSLLAPLGAEAKKGIVDWTINTYEQNNSYSLPASGQIEVAFSPNEGAENLFLKTIDSAKNEIKMLAYLHRDRNKSKR